MRAYAQAWRFKHPSPWDYAFSMDRALGRDLGWFWYSWLFTTDAVDGSIQRVRTSGASATVTVRQDGQMPSPVVLAVHFAPTGPRVRPMKNAQLVDDSTAIVTWPVDVWFGGSRTFEAQLNFGPRKIVRIVLDPHCRFPDHNVEDNTWPRQPAARGGGRGRAWPLRPARVPGIGGAAAYFAAARLAASAGQSRRAGTSSRWSAAAVGKRSRGSFARQR